MCAWVVYKSGVDAGGWRGCVGEVRGREWMWGIDTSIAVRSSLLSSG